MSQIFFCLFVCHLQSSIITVIVRVIFNGNMSLPSLLVVSSRARKVMIKITLIIKMIMIMVMIMIEMMMILMIMIKMIVM